MSPRRVAGSNPARGSTIEPPSAFSSILEFGFHLKKEGYAEESIKRAVKVLKRLSRLGDLAKPEDMKAVLTRLDKWTTASKEIASNWLDGYYRFKGICWTKPRYQRVTKPAFLPTDAEVDQLKAGCTRNVAIFIQFLKETGVRRGEAYALSWMDLDLEHGMARITPEKHSNPRVVKLSSHLCGLLGTLPKNRRTIWGNSSIDNFTRLFQKQRKRLAERLQSPRLMGIHFHSLRHLKGTQEYHRTKDILWVQKYLGHKRIQSTLTYVQLLPYGEDEYVCKAAKSLEEASSLIESGFDYVTDLDGTKLFRKRK